MLIRTISILSLITVLATATSFAQKALYFNGHLSLQPGQSVKQTPYYTTGITTPFADTVKTTLGIGGGASIGYMFGPSFGIYLNGDVVFQSEDHDPKHSYSANTFDFDVGARIHFLRDNATAPYVQLNYGYSELSVTVGVPMITTYVSPGGGAAQGPSFSNGVNTWGGSHLGVTLGLEFKESELADKVLGRWDVGLVVALSSYQDAPTITTFRLNFGYNFWFLF
jgi:hypothetical protein